MGGFYITEWTDIQPATYRHCL